MWSKLLPEHPHAPGNAQIKRDDIIWIFFYVTMEKKKYITKKKSTYRNFVIFVLTKCNWWKDAGDFIEQTRLRSLEMFHSCKCNERNLPTSWLAQFLLLFIIHLAKPPRQSRRLSVLSSIKAIYAPIPAGNNGKGWVDKVWRPVARWLSHPQSFVKLQGSSEPSPSP